MQAVTFSCDACGAPYHHGPHRYDGHKIHAYDMMVCDTCYNANWDGWAPLREPGIIKHLEGKGIPIPKRNSKGWIPRGA